MKTLGRKLFAVVLVPGLLGATAVLAGEPQSEKVDFDTQVRPLLAGRCFKCHGPDEDHQEGGLGLHSFEAATRELDSGERAIVPGKPEQSALIARVTSTEDFERMPPPGAGEPLKPQEVELLRRWIAQGAHYQKHWAYVPPRRAELPPVKHRRWARNPIDYFILARLEAAGLEPSPPASRYELIRRLSLDLRGLPPSLQEAEAFAHDPDPAAYEKLVDRYLADPAYGERWARVWLDLARYADSKGYGSDPLREIWAYRDWVIRALNANMPYDQFTIEQLAGDLLPRPTLQQRIATAFHRNTMTNTEGGTDDEEFRVAAVMDRVETTWQVWMGLTMQCAKCHNHKYDPIKQREYYQFFAFFNQTADNDQPDERPTLEVPWPEAQRRIEQHNRKIAQAEKQLAQERKQLRQLRAQAVQAARELLPLVAPGGPGSDPTRAEARKHYQAVAAELEKAQARVKQLEKQLASLKKNRPKLPTVPVMQELPPEKRRKTFVLDKGNFLVPKEEVQPGVPKAFHPWPKGAPKNRLGVALWLVDRRNPLTARVQVNRIWAELFGRGIVETQEDFGVQGMRPTHPKLLDWLAVWYMDNGWDTKRLIRLIVTSATYRQSSRVRPEHLQRDPRNLLLARGPRFRLEGEMIRDQALFVSGLLSRKMFGPSVYPPQPPGLWRAAFNGRDRKWPTSTGADRYRRAIYTFWRRTVPYPAMATFDAPSREVCTVRRVRTNIPLQAFVTLNDEAFVEMAQALGRRILREGGSSLEDKARYGLRLCLIRPPTQAEVAEIVRLYRDAVAELKQTPEAARQLATEPLGPLPQGTDPVEAAAWTTVANVLLNLDGVLSKN